MNATIRHAASLAAVVLGLGAVGAGCLTRPVEHEDPTTKTNVQIQVPNQAVDKIDMLFDIDNSASMGDKQAYLQKAIPRLIDRLVNPNCVDIATASKVNGQSVGGAACPAGYKTEFPAVHDMHLGIVTSSLGTRLSDTPTPASNFPVICGASATVDTPYQNLSKHNDDQGHLISRGPLTLTATGGTEGTVADAAAGYLYWFPAGTPTGPAPTIAKAAQLESDFTDLISGAGIFGCGIESQLESWYRFLIQPDPYEKLQLNSAGRAEWADGVDTTILKERHDFLRPDSLVVVVVLSDENDSEIDVRAFGGQGFNFMHSDYPPFPGTKICATDPDNAACVPCLDRTNPDCAVHNSATDWGFDVNLRHVHMKAKYGLDPQYPIGRYYLGLTSTVVPYRGDEYPPGANNYVGCTTDSSGNCVPSCTNPLFAASLPDGTKTDHASLCTLPVGQRANQKSNIFFAHIGGVPYQLLHFDPTDLTKSVLSQADWTRILGKGAASYTVSPGATLTHDYTGIDPHMLESYLDRTIGLNTGSVDSSKTNNLAPSTGGNTDPVNGREWVTDQPAPPQTASVPKIGHQLAVDRQYACIFPLVDTTTGAKTPRDCTLGYNQTSCDCPQSSSGLMPAEIPPVCDPTTPTSQVAAKAYPTVRELLLTKLMGSQGIVASICPQDVQDMGTATAPDPLFGYNPAVAVIVDRLKTALNSACLPEKLGSTDAGAGAVPCLVLVKLPVSTQGGTCTAPKCDATAGLYGPGVATPNAGSNPPLDQTVLNNFCAQQESDYTNGGGIKGAAGDPANQSVCMLYQYTSSDSNASTEFTNGSCSAYTPPAGSPGGWCYVTGAAANGCPQAVQFGSHSLPGGSVTYLQCIEESISVVSANTGH